MGCRLWKLLSLAWVASKATNPWVAQDQGSKFARIGSTMTTSVKVWMSSLVSTMLICQREELNVIERNTCNCFRPTWKLASHVMMAKLSWIALWVLMRSLPWTQCKKWIPIGLMGCVHAHQRMFTIEGWGSLSYVQSIVEKIGENNWKVGKTGWTVSQMLAYGPKHDKIRARWALDISLESMLERVWWCKHSKMESWSWTICYLISCSNGRRYAQVECGRKSRRLEVLLKRKCVIVNLC
jgi:hypothetical protein